MTSHVTEQLLNPSASEVVVIDSPGRTGGDSCPVFSESLPASGLTKWATTLLNMLCQLTAHNSPLSPPRRRQSPRWRVSCAFSV